MTALVAAVLGALAATGLVLIVAAILGAGLPAQRGTTRARRTGPALVDPRVLAAALIAGVVAPAVTGTVAVGLVVAAVVIVVPLLRRAGLDRRAQLARTEALAGWAETLRDYMRSHAGLHQAVASSAEVVDPVIRGEVQALARDLERLETVEALRRVADRARDPVADLAIAALSVAAGDSGARDLPALLGALADDAREEVAGVRRAAVTHRRSFSAAQSMMWVVALVTVVMFSASGEYLRVYQTARGQIVLVAVAACAIGALAALVRLARPVQPLRVLAESSVEAAS